MLTDGFHDVPAGRIAMVVTHLEMRAPPPSKPAAVCSGLSLRRVSDPPREWYRRLYRRVGEAWLWFSRLKLDDDALAAIITDDDVEVYALQHEGEDVGLLELDFREATSCELAFFGVIPDLIGLGAGRFLMTAATDRAWLRPIERFHVHTCTLDHPSALAFYRRSGFVAYRQQIEIAEDPRLTGLMPRTAAPHVPVFDELTV